MRVLTVDDSRTILAMLHHTLTNAGFEVLQAENGQVGLDVLGREDVDVVITDINMPVMDGIEFLRTLRAEPGGKAPVVVLCSVENDREHIAEALEAGADEYIMKPFDSEIVRSKLVLLELIG